MTPDPLEPKIAADATRRPPAGAIEGIERGFEAEGELAEPPRRRPSVLVVSLVVGLVLAVAATVFDFI